MDLAGTSIVSVPAAHWAALVPVRSADFVEGTNMMASSSGLQLRSTVRTDGILELSLASVPTPRPGADEVIVRVEASPLNPSDMGLLFAGTDMSAAQAGGAVDNPTVTARLSPAVMAAMAGRAGQSLPVGNEGAGTVIDAGGSPGARALLGKTVAIFGGAMYSQYRCIKADQCLLLPPGTSAAEGASCFVNPLTVLGMVGTMRAEGHKALVHTAAASNLGQMLNRLCLKDGVGLVNVVRKPEQEQLLREQGAAYVCNSTSPAFMDDLTEAISKTGAMLAFDAIGGGRLAGQILTAMEVAANRAAQEYSRYGSNVYKQVHIYGGLDRGPTEFTRNFGLAWGIGGWLLTPYLQKIGPGAAQQLRERVAAEITTTFASHYVEEISLAEALQLDKIAAYGKQATGEKYLLTPNKGLSPA
jgi:NADPH2:quinone reductase